MLTFSWLLKVLYSVILKFSFICYIFAYIRVILKVKWSGGKNGQFLHNRASNA
jgi:hypothetical protein